MRTEAVNLFRLEIARPKTNNWPCEAVCALRLESKLNKGNRGLFNLIRERRYHAASHGHPVHLLGDFQE